MFNKLIDKISNFFLEEIKSKSNNNEWNENGINSITNNKYDSLGWDINGWSFHGINKETRTKFDSDGYNMSGYDVNGYDKSGQHFSDTEVYYNQVLNSTYGILIALLAKIAKADGEISIKEAEYISKQIDIINPSQATRHIYSKKIIDNEKDITSNISILCKNLSETAKDISFVQKLIGIIKVDNKLHEKQYELLNKIMNYLGIDETNKKKLKIELLEKLNNEYHELEEKLYQLKLEKENILYQKDQFNYEEYQSFGNIKLDLLNVKKEKSNEFLEEYKKQVEFCEKYKNYKLDTNKSISKNKKIDLLNLNTLNQMIKIIKYDIKIYLQDLESIKQDKVYQNFLTVTDKNKYFKIEKERIEKELYKLSPKIEKKNLKSMSIQKFKL